MAAAKVFEVQGEIAFISGANAARQKFVVVFLGPDVAGGTDMEEITVDFVAADTNTTMKNKIRDAVIAVAAARGSKPAYTITAANMILPTFQRG